MTIVSKRITPVVLKKSKSNVVVIIGLTSDVYFRYTLPNRILYFIEDAS